VLQKREKKRSIQVWNDISKYLLCSTKEKKVSAGLEQHEGE